VSFDRSPSTESVEEEEIESFDSIILSVDSKSGSLKLQWKENVDLFNSYQSAHNYLLSNFEGTKLCA
jgi:hypothetical protein